MKSWFSFLLVCCFSVCALDAQETKSTKANNVIVLDKEFVMPEVNDLSHKVWIYLPLGYSKSKETYPVIYMHDGQNLFDDKTSYVGEWKVDEILNKMYEKTKKGFIVVGIEHGGEERVNEYTPWPNNKYGGGKGKAYVDFIVNTLKPYIDKSYRTKPEKEHTAIIGSSLGGLISFYAGLQYPEVFGKVGALSTSFWFSDEVFNFTKEQGNQKDQKLFLLVGGKEGGSMDSDMYKIEKILIDSGFNKNNLISKLNKEAKHNEAFWSSEFEGVVKWLFDIK